MGVGGAKKRIDALLRIGRKVNMAVEMVDGDSEDKIKDVTAELLKIETVPEITHFFIHFDDGAILVDRKGIEDITEGGCYKVVDTEKLFDDLEIILSEVPTSDFKKNEADELLSLFKIGLITKMKRMK